MIGRFANRIAHSQFSRGYDHSYRLYVECCDMVKPLLGWFQEIVAWRWKRSSCRIAPVILGGRSPIDGCKRARRIGTQRCWCSDDLISGGFVQRRASALIRFYRGQVRL